MTLKSWLKKIFNRTGKPDSADTGHHEAITLQLVVKSHEVSDEEMAQIKQQRKQNAKEWAALGYAEQRRRRIEGFRANAQRNRERAMQAGITHYVWVWPKVPECDIGERNNGKIFSYAEPPPEGHPCEGECHAKDWCRCSTRSVVEGFS